MPQLAGTQACFSPAELLERHNRFQLMTADYNALPAGQKYDGIRLIMRSVAAAEPARLRSAA